MSSKNKIKKKEEAKATKVSKTRAITYTVDAILIRSPLKFLTDAINEKRFLEGIVVSVTYFERFGVDKLKEYFKSKDIPLEAMKFENLQLPAIMRMLEGFDIISHKIHSLMGEVRKERNIIVHELRLPDDINEKEAVKTIKKAIECLKALGAS